MYKFGFSIVCFLIFSVSSWAKTYSEDELLALSQKSSKVEEVEAQFSLLNAEIASVLTNFSPVLKAQASYNKTNEQPLIQFMPPNKPYYATEVVVEKASRYGFKYSVGLYGESLTSTNMINSARVGPKVSLSANLLKNFLGRESANQVRALESKSKFLEIQKQITKDALSTQVRKLFWNYNLLKRQEEISEEIIKLNERLVRDLKKKKRDGFVEEGDLLGAESQLKGLRAQNLMLQYNSNQILKGLSSILPDLEPGFKIEKVTFSDKLPYLRNCLSEISKYQNTPYELSLYSEQIRAKEKEFSFLSKSLKGGTLPELSFFAELSQSHVAQNSQTAYEEFYEESKFGYSLGLNFSLPLDGSLKKENKDRLLGEKLKVKSETENIKRNLDALHQDMKSSVLLLSQALEQQEQNSKILEKSYRFKKRKYGQARVDMQDLLIEQNKLLSSKINEIDIIKVIVDSLLEYKSTFQSYECSGVKGA